ncbi:MAG: hypothetical protein ABIW84_07695 [Ilumatobacteraceae bacterium]
MSIATEKATETRFVRAYLDGLDKQDLVDPKVAAELEATKERLLGKLDVLQKLDAVQKVIDLESQLNPKEVREREFLRVVKMYSERHGLTPAAWAEAGVSSEVLSKAGMKIASPAVVPPSQIQTSELADLNY